MTATAKILVEDNTTESKTVSHGVQQNADAVFDFLSLTADTPQEAMAACALTLAVISVHQPGKTEVHKKAAIALLEKMFDHCVVEHAHCIAENDHIDSTTTDDHHGHTH